MVMDGQWWRQKSRFYIRRAGTASATTAATTSCTSSEQEQSSDQTKVLQCVLRLSIVLSCSYGHLTSQLITGFTLSNKKVAFCLLLL